MVRWVTLLYFMVARGARAEEPAGAGEGAQTSQVPGVTPEEVNPEQATETVPADAPAAPAPPLTAIAPSPEERLNQAVRAYQEGRPDEARVALATLVNDPTPMPPELRQQARVYLGEVLYVQGQEDAAFKVFEVLLQEDPDYHVDPFRHPPDVCGFFEVVRASVTSLAPRPILPAPLPQPLPRSALVGFGVYQRNHGDARLGNTLLIGQLTLGLASAGGYGWLVSQRHYSGEDTLTRLNVAKAAQWGVTLGFWGLYTWGTLDARAHWRRSTSAAEDDDKR